MKKLSIYILSLCAAATAVSCNKLLETSPRESIDLETATKSKDAIKATIISVYANMRTVGYYGRNFIVQPEVLADNGEITASNSNRFVGESNNSPRAQVDIWTAAYSNIFRCNYIMKYAVQAKGFTASELDQLLGEAYFLRAYGFFDLVRSYARNPKHLINNFDAGVPLVTEALLDVTNPAFPGYPSRAKVDDVYAQIVKDLDSAAARLGKAEADPEIGVLAPFRASKLAAVSLNSRVKLYRGDWAGAEADATAAINMMPFNSPKLKVEFVSDSATYMSKWGNLHPEMIFGLSFEAYEAFGSDAIQSIFYKHPILGGYGDITPRKGLLDDYYPSDPRRTSLLKSAKKGTQDVFYCMKWPGAKPFEGGDDIMLIRASEMYLNRAEARARQGGKDADALDDLNKVHTRLKLTPLAGLAGDDLVTAILKERRLELAFEGHRLFDLMRTGRDLVKTSGTTVITITNDDYKLIAPLPTAEVDVNKNLVQNPQY